MGGQQEGWSMGKTGGDLAGAGANRPIARPAPDVCPIPLRSLPAMPKVNAFDCDQAHGETVRRCRVEGELYPYCQYITDENRHPCNTQAAQSNAFPSHQCSYTRTTCVATAGEGQPQRSPLGKLPKFIPIEVQRGVWGVERCTWNCASRITGAKVHEPGLQDWVWKGRGWIWQLLLLPNQPSVGTDPPSSLPYPAPPPRPCPILSSLPTYLVSRSPLSCHRHHYVQQSAVLCTAGDILATTIMQSSVAEWILPADC